MNDAFTLKFGMRGYPDICEVVVTTGTKGSVMAPSGGFVGLVGLNNPSDYATALDEDGRKWVRNVAHAWFISKHGFSVYLEKPIELFSTSVFDYSLSSGDNYVGVAHYDGGSRCISYKLGREEGLKIISVEDDNELRQDDPILYDYITSREGVSC